MADIGLTQVSAALLNCLCAAVSGHPNPPMHCCYRVEWEVPEDMAESDLCCEGLAYVVMGDQWLSSASFPEQDIIRQIQGVCAPPTWAVQFKIGILRCIPNGMQVTCAEEAVSFAQEIQDSDALREASCCIREWVKENAIGMDVVIDRQQKTTQGGCMDRYVTVTIQFNNYDCGC